jgi:hypothetical protein
LGVKSLGVSTKEEGVEEKDSSVTVVWVNYEGVGKGCLMSVGDIGGGDPGRDWHG